MAEPFRLRNGREGSNLAIIEVNISYFRPETIYLIMYTYRLFRDVKANFSALLHSREFYFRTNHRRPLCILAVTRNNERWLVLYICFIHIMPLNGKVNSEEGWGE